MGETIFYLADLIDYRKNQIRSRVLNKKLSIEMSMVIYAAAQGETISTEETDQTKIIQVIEGTLQITSENGENQLNAGGVVVLSPKTQHALEAITPCKFLQIETV